MAGLVSLVERLPDLDDDVDAFVLDREFFKVCFSLARTLKGLYRAGHISREVTEGWLGELVSQEGLPFDAAFVLRGADHEVHEWSARLPWHWFNPDGSRAVFQGETVWPGFLLGKR